MKQHSFCTDIDGLVLDVLIWWDSNRNKYCMKISYPENRNVQQIFYSSSHDAYSMVGDLDYYVSLLELLNIQLPSGMYEKILEDKFYH